MVAEEGRGEEDLGGGGDIHNSGGNVRNLSPPMID